MWWRHSGSACCKAAVCADCRCQTCCDACLLLHQHWLLAQGRGRHVNAPANPDRHGFNVCCLLTARHKDGVLLPLYRDLPGKHTMPAGMQNEGCGLTGAIRGPLWLQLRTCLLATCFRRAGQIVHPPRRPSPGRRALSWSPPASARMAAEPWAGRGLRGRLPRSRGSLGRQVGTTLGPTQVDNSC